MKKKYKNFQELMQKYPSLKTNLYVKKTTAKKGFDVIIRIGSFDFQSDACDMVSELLKGKYKGVDEAIDARLEKVLLELSDEGLIKFKGDLYTLAKPPNKGRIH
jgi:hypothetical protein|tara:strand:+ start:1379 stop:1690 length:312 start_codon:yes stop_codon:yes gene_type:complete